MIKNREWIFRVSLRLEPGERVYVTGSCKELGSWDPENLIPLVKEGSLNDDFDQDCETVWKISLHLPTEKIVYRFCVCMGINNTMRRWETNIHPRIIPADESNTDDPEILYFGYINSFNKIDQGWLINECALFLRLCRSNVHNDPVVLWKKKHKDKKCFVKVTPVDISKTSNMESFLDYPTEESTEVDLLDLRMKSTAVLPIVEVSVMKEGSTEFRSQDQFGVCCTNEEYISFQCRLIDPLVIGFLLDYYLEASEGEVPQYVGCSFILPTTFKDNYGVAILPITSTKHIPIGQLTVTYMVVHPLRDYKCSMEVSYARHWKESWRGLEVGHRGAGNSFHSQTKNCANIRENTIASLKHAYESGADMVEFDVQLSKDLVPLIYHDFHASISLRHKREPLKTDLMLIAIKDLTLAQLQNLKVYHKTEQGLSKFCDDDFEDHEPFPTLERALESVPESCGFNIEVKWTMRLKDGTYELDHPFELNRFLDCILKVVLQSASRRKIIFSSFHPDICTMLRLKQNLYPVLFLTMGETKIWAHYDDIRTRSISTAVYYASSANILGVNVHTEDILKDSSQIKLAFDHDLIAFCWGDQNSDREVINRLKELGMHGIIYDKIDEYSTKDDNKRSSVFLCDDKETCRCFPESCKTNINSDEKGYSYQMQLSAAAVDNQPSSLEESMSEKHTYVNGGRTSTSFCGILNEMTVESVETQS